MIYVGVALGLVAFLGIGGWVFMTMLDNSPRDGRWCVAAAVGFSLLVLMIWLADVVTKNSPPCAQYETQMMYNAAIKTMMPAQFCAKEGIWK